MEILKHLTTKEAGYLEALLSDPIKRIKEHSDIELSENEIAEALIKAKSIKSRKLEYDQRVNDSRERYKALMQPFTPDDLIKYCLEYYHERFGTRFIIDKDNHPVISHLALYLTGAKEFNMGGFSLNKGIFLMGPVGNGKTEIMKFFQKNKKQCFEILSSAYVADQFMIYKQDFDSVFSTPKENAVNDSTFFFQKYLGRCFDDLGVEELKNDHGNKKNALADILMTIYQKKDFTKTFITTNLNEEEIEQKYGSRVKSRIREMFNVFVLEGNDRRK